MKLSEIKMNYQRSLDQQEKLLSKDHIKYEVKISYKDKTFIVPFQCNKKDRPSKKDVLSCLLSDMMAYNEYTDIDEFQRVFGYEKVSECLEVFQGCKTNSERMHSMFTEEELTELDRLVNC